LRFHFILCDWIFVVFDRNIRIPWRSFFFPPKSRSKRSGLLATRCPFRPNPVGPSLVVVEYVRMGDRREEEGGVERGEGEGKWRRNQREEEAQKDFEEKTEQI
jgi:hypothetical protein